jgi:hypothetical protein
VCSRFDCYHPLKSAAMASGLERSLLEGSRSCLTSTRRKESRLEACPLGGALSSDGWSPGESERSPSFAARRIGSSSVPASVATSSSGIVACVRPLTLAPDRRTVRTGSVSANGLQQSPKSHSSLSERPNQAMERTSDGCAIAFEMTSTLHSERRASLSVVAHLVLVRPHLRFP